MPSNIETITLAGGCFWCTEAIFKRLKGVILAMPGYSGGWVKNPTYEEVSKGKTGHVEAIQVEFDREKIGLEKILDVFWHTHNPTTINRQGDDVGPQYRSVIFFRNSSQKKTIDNSKSDLEKERIYKDPIVTEIIPFRNFYKAEDYHKNYFENHKENLYCTVVISPKIKKLTKEFREEVKEL